jgi:hypothetical protein
MKAAKKVSAKKAPKKAGMKPGAGKTWSDKVADPTKTYEVKRLDKDFSDMRAGDKMLIATPAIIDDYVRQIPKGKSVSLLTMRKDLANEYRADNTCPLTTGIFLRIVSEAAHEQLEKGLAVSKVAPFWRVVETKSPLNKKLSFGADFVKKQREKEGLER